MVPGIMHVVSGRGIDHLSYMEGPPRRTSESSSRTISNGNSSDKRQRPYERNLATIWSYCTQVKKPEGGVSSTLLSSSSSK